MENNEIKVTQATIDKDVLDIMKQKDVLDTLKSERDMKRLELNFACEMLSTVKELSTALNDLMNVLTICSADKLTEFFKEVKKNVTGEQKRVELQNKIKKSHLKPKKTQKITKKDKTE